MRVGVEEKIKEEEGGLVAKQGEGPVNRTATERREQMQEEKEVEESRRMGRWARDGGEGREEWAVGWNNRNEGKENREREGGEVE